jgi:hypothetical protein
MAAPTHPLPYVGDSDLEARLDEVIAAVEAHMDDISDERDARLYARVFGPTGDDHRVDDPNDWPEP